MKPMHKILLSFVIQLTVQATVCFWNPTRQTIAGVVLQTLYWVLGDFVFRTAKSSFQQKEDKHNSTMNVMRAILIMTILPCVCYIAGLHELVGLPVMDKLVPVVFGIMIFGMILRFWSMSVLRQNFTTVLKIAEKASVIQSGPYSVVRHPGYTGNMLVFISYSLLVSNSAICTLVCFVIFARAWSQRIAHEERMMADEFKDDYEQYRKRVTARLVPFVW